MTTTILHDYVLLRIAHANAVELKASDQARAIAARLDGMLAEHADLDASFRQFYADCAAQSSVATSDDEMASKIRKHFSGDRVDN